MKDLARFSGGRVETRPKARTQAAPKHKADRNVAVKQEVSAPPPPPLAVQLLTIAEEDAGQRIDNFLLRICKGVPKSHIYRVLRSGEVRVNKGRIDQTYRLVEGDVIRVPPIRIAEKQEQVVPGAEFKILLEDNHLLVIDKPAGVAVHGGSGVSYGVIEQLRAARPQAKFLELVHRLDRDTSGVLLIARTALAASGLSASLALRDTSKVYWALTRGMPKQKHGVVKGALAKEGGHGPHGRDERMAMTEEGEEGAKFSLTEYAVMATAGSEFAWVAARPITGRTHQIRVHLASLGTPIVGDFKYGGAESRGKGDIADKLHLHARSIDIGRPDGGRLQATAPLPPHMVKSWKLLGFDPDDKRDPFPPKKTTKRSSSEAVAPKKTQKR